MSKYGFLLDGLHHIPDSSLPLALILKEESGSFHYLIMIGCVIPRMSFLEAIPMVCKYLFKYVPALPFFRFHTSIIISH